MSVRAEDLATDQLGVRGSFEFSTRKRASSWMLNGFCNNGTKISSGECRDNRSSRTHGYPATRFVPISPIQYHPKNQACGHPKARSQIWSLALTGSWLRLRKQPTWRSIAGERSKASGYWRPLRGLRPAAISSSRGIRRRALGSALVSMPADWQWAIRSRWLYPGLPCLEFGYRHHFDEQSHRPCLGPAGSAFFGLGGIERFERSSYLLAVHSTSII